MARDKDVNWNLQDRSLASVQIAVLMDLRDELKELNRLLGCSNFTDLPRVLRQIRANTTTIKNEVKGKK